MSAVLDEALLSMHYIDEVVQLLDSIAIKTEDSDFSHWIETMSHEFYSYSKDLEKYYDRNRPCNCCNCMQCLGMSNSDF